MATDLEQLVLSISADNRQMLRVLRRLDGDTSAATRKVEKHFDRMAARIDGRLSGIGKGAFTGLVGGVTAALGARELVGLTDTWTDLSSRIENAVGSAEKGEATLSRLSEVARRTYSNLETTAEGFLLNAKTMEELGYSTDQTLDYVEAVNNALVISGAKAQRAEQVWNALSKAMAVGKLSGENLNTVISTGGRVAEALAKSMGVSTIELRRLGEQGKITTAHIVGISKELAGLREEADAMPATISDGFTLLSNALLEYVGNADKATEVSARISEALIIIADNFDQVADAGLQLAAVLAGALLGRSLGRMLVAVPAAVTAMTGLVTAMRVGTLVAGTFSAALGPVGLALGAVSAAIFVLAGRQDDAERAAETHRATLEKVAPVLDDVKGATDEAILSVAALGDEWVLAAKKAVASASAQLQAARTLAEADAAVYIGQVQGGRGRTWTDRDFDAASRLSDVADRDPRLAAYLENVNRAASDLNQAQAAIDKIQKEMEERDIQLPPITVRGSGSGADGKGDDKWGKELDRWKERIANIRAATEAQRGLNPLVTDYGYSAEQAKAQQELLNAAQRAGLIKTAELSSATPQLREQIIALADGYASATVEAAKLGETQDEIRRKAEEMREFQKDLTRGIVDGFIQGKNAAEILSDALSQLGNKLLDLAFNAAFSSSGQGGVFGVLSGLFGGFREKGGPVQAGKAYVVGEKRPELFVPGQSGTILPGVPEMPKASGMSRGSASQFTYAPTIDMRGTSAEAVARLEQVLMRDKAEFQSRVVATVRRAQNTGAL